MTSPEPNPACQGRVSGRVSMDTRGAMLVPRHGTCLSGTDIRSDIRGYPTVSYAFRTTRQGNPWGLPRGPGRSRLWNQVIVIPSISCPAQVYLGHTGPRVPLADVAARASQSLAKTSFPPLSGEAAISFF